MSNSPIRKSSESPEKVPVSKTKAAKRYIKQQSNAIKIDWLWNNTDRKWFKHDSLQRLNATHVISYSMYWNLGIRVLEIHFIWNSKQILILGCIRYKFQ